MAIKKQRSQVVMNADEIRESYAKLPTEDIAKLLALLAPHADSNASTREFFDMLSEIVTERAKLIKFEKLANLRAQQTRTSMKQYETVYNSLTLAEMCEYWQYMMTTHARTLNDAEHCQRMQQKCQAALYEVMR